MEIYKNSIGAWIKDLKAIYKHIRSFSNLRYAFIVLMGIYLLATTAIIRADVAYIDDMGRKVFGYTGWDNFSRYLSNELSQFIHTSHYLADASPLTQYIAIFFIVLASMILIITFKNDKKITAWDLFAVLPLGLSPYFLECLSYKYDSPYMALSVLGSIIPILFYHSHHFLFFTSIVIGILVSCTTYQASLGIFPMLIVFLSVKEFVNMSTIKEIGKKLAV